MVDKNNDNLVLICGESAGGKSASLRNIKDQKGVLYLNCEANKKLPFKSGFRKMSVTNPLVVPSVFTQAETIDPPCHTIVIDTLTFLMEMYESMYVLHSGNTMTAWGEYAQYFKNLMQDNVAKSTKNVIFLAHTRSILNESEMTMEKKVPVKGALQNNGLEAYFSCVIAAKKVPLITLENFKNDLLTITPEDELLGVKYVYQTRLTKETVNERIRSPMGMWSQNETFIDNDAQLVINRLHEYYT